MHKDRRAAELNVSKLTSYLEGVLGNTNEARKRISKSCEETRKVLKCWDLPDQEESTTVTEHKECTCHISAFDKNSDEIAKGIGDIVENAQKLREKITINKSKVASTYPNSKLAPTRNGNTTRKSSSSTPLSGGSRNGLSKTSIQNLRAGRTINAKTVKSEPLPVPKLKRTPSAQSTYQKDFASRPSSRHSNDSIKASTMCTNETGTSIKNSHNGPITMEQLEQLLDRVAVDATLYPSQNITIKSIDTPNETKKPFNKNCAIHGNDLIVQKPRSSVVGLKEAISLVGVPSKLVKILQPYHRFLSQRQMGEQRIESKTAAKFLSRLNKMNKANWEEAIYEPLPGVFAKYLPLCSKVSQLAEFEDKLSSHTVAQLRANLEQLDTAYRNCTGKEISPNVNTPRSISDDVDCDAKVKNSALALAGIWNERSIAFEGMGDALCIRYNNVKQLEQFHHSIQRIQSLDFQSGLLDLISKEIVPRLGQVDSSDAAYFLLVKTLIALCDLEHFKLPIIVKSS